MADAERLEEIRKWFDSRNDEREDQGYLTYIEADCDDIDFLLAQLDLANKRTEVLRVGLRTLRNEVKGTLHAHRFAIGYDHGNSNWACLEMAIAGAEEALAAEEMK